MRQQFINDPARQLLMVATRAFDQSDGFRKQPAVLLANAFDQFFRINRIHIEVFTT
jgi:hypothetical protein